MRKVLCMLLLALFVLPARAAYWEDNGDIKIECLQGNPACQVLQLVMLGSFDFFDPSDELTGRILSAALPSLRAVNEADFAHFVDSFDVEADMVHRYYYIALGNSLWADISQRREGLTQEEQWLLTLLAPPVDEAQRQARQRLCEQLDEAQREAMANALQAPQGFVAYLAQTVDWRSEE